MAPTLRTRVPDGAGWLHEIKYDGFRIQVHIQGDRVRLWTRNGNDWTDRLQHPAASLRGLRARSAVIDGELVVCDERGVPDMKRLRAASAARRSESMTGFVFDLLWFNDRDLRAKPLCERKSRLRELVDEVPGVHYVDHIEGPVNPPELYRHICEMGLEGVISKRATSAYVSGPTRLWLKVKCPVPPERAEMDWGNDRKRERA